MGADGTSLNGGDRDGLCTIMSQEMLWIVYMWCLAHWLDFVLKSGMGDTFFE